MLTIAVTNMKGGVGKTAETLGLASAGSARKLRVLVVDLDPQGNSTMCLAPDLDDATELTLYDVLRDGRRGGVEEAVRSTGWEGVDLVPAQLELDSLEGSSSVDAFHRLSVAMTGLDRWDLVLIDCRPSVGQLVSNALVVADKAVIVTELGRASIKGIAAAMEHFEVVKMRHNPRLQMGGIAINKADPRQAEEAYRLSEIRDTYPGLTIEPVMPSRTVIKQSFGSGVPIHQFTDAAAREVAAVYDTHLSHLLGS